MTAIIIGILIISLLIGQSPAILISARRMAAVLMLVFKDPILGLVAGIQPSANDMLKLGDWLEMPEVRRRRRGDRYRPHHGQGAQLGTIPSPPFRPGRWSLTRLKARAYIIGGVAASNAALTSTPPAFIFDEQEQQRLIRAKLLKPYMDSRHEEISAWNQQYAGEQSDPQRAAV